jgi:hypothetical protein
MLKDIIAESEKQFEAKYKSTFIPLFGYKNPDDGREKEVIAEHAWFNFKKEVVAQTAQLVAREVLRKVREVVVKLEYSESDVDGNHSYDRARQNEGYKYAQEDTLTHLQSLEEELTK